MFPAVKEVVFGEKKIKCYDLTYGFMVGIDSGDIEETVQAVVENGTDLSIDEVLELRRSEVLELHKTILQLTYPDLYNDDGTLKSIDVDDTLNEDDDKKKV